MVFGNFWEHVIQNENDFNRHVDYIHWNPVKHGWVNQVKDCIQAFTNL